MKTWKKFCALLVILTVSSFGVLAHQDDKNGDKKKPKVPIVDKKEDKQDKDRQNRDEKSKDKKPPR